MYKIYHAWERGRENLGKQFFSYVVVKASVENNLGFMSYGVYTGIAKVMSSNLAGV